ncbi:MAG TPA: tRNA (adenine(22)-N(1))-methyltransferase TrmK [Candidatus Dormibacteraeota bacterium]
MTISAPPALALEQWASDARPAGPARLGARLRAVVDLCPRDGPVADVASGHGRVARELKRRGSHRVVYATEVGSGPSGELRRLLGDASGVQILEGAGLRPLAGRGCQGVVIAGLGGGSIARLLEQDYELASGLDWLCLQPAQRVERLEAWLARVGWSQRCRRQVLERDHVYQLFLVIPR